MKKLTVVCMVFLATIAASLVALTVHSFASAKHPAAQQEPFEGSAAWQKLDLRMRQAWKDANAAGDAGRVFECLIKIDEPNNKDDRAILTGAGFVPRTYAGSVVTGSVRAGNLPDVARLPFVKVMELAVPLELKKRH
ncbi:MAG: hypothetical protein WC956_04210 [bacterium]